MCGVVCRQPVDLVLAVDTSTSIGRANMVRLFDYCKSLVVSLDRRSRFGVVTFSDRPRVALNLTDELSYRTLDSLSAAYMAASSTDTASALSVVHQMLTSAAASQSQRRRAALIVVDGRCVYVYHGTRISHCTTVA